MRRARSTRKLLLLAIVASPAAIAAVGGVALSQSGGGVGVSGGAPSGSLSLVQARDLRFPIYYPGDAVEGHALNVILRGYNSSPIDDVDFLYGTCTPKDDEGCPAPIEVQVWPACARNLSSYSASIQAEREDGTVRGVPAAFFENGNRLELQTGISTVVIFAGGRDQALRVANSLRGLNVALGAGTPLPPPAAGAVQGQLSC